MDGDPELLLCDTSFINNARRRQDQPERYAHWDPEMLARIDAAVLAISVITLAEARFGYLNARWGERRIAEEENRLASFLQLPLSAADLDRWAELRAAAERRGAALSHNDLWIAAAAATNEHPLLTCDQDHLRLADELPVEVIYLPVAH